MGFWEIYFADHYHTVFLEAFETKDAWAGDVSPVSQTLLLLIKRCVDMKLFYLFSLGQITNCTCALLIVLQSFSIKCIFIYLTVVKNKSCEIKSIFLSYNELIVLKIMVDETYTQLL